MKRKVRKKRKARGEVFKKIKKEKRVCYFCGTSENITEHHVIFRAFGGERLENNKEDICESCHQKFHALIQPMVNVFLQTIQRLQPKEMRKIGFVITNGKKSKKITKVVKKL